MTSPARILAYDLLRRIEVQAAHSDVALHSKSVTALKPVDRNLVTEIVYGTLRWQAFLDYILASESSRPWEDVDVGLKILLRMSLYQMWHMERIPDHALVNEAVEIAKKRFKRGAEGFINGMLRSVCRRRRWKDEQFARECPQWIQASLPFWLWERWTRRFGAEQAYQYAMSLNEPPQAAARLEDAMAFPNPPDADMHRSELVPGAILRRRTADFAGSVPRARMRFQDEASQLIPYLFGCVAGWRLLDACAAPGGKTCILREMSGTAGYVVAADASWKRARRLLETLGSSSGARYEVIVADAAESQVFRIPFDGVLVDVPCSGLGTIRRNPEIKWRLNRDQLKVFQEKQARIISAASASVRPGGLLLYSTCSTEPEENEDVVESFLASHTEFRLQAPDCPPGIEMWTDASGFLRTYPSTRLWDGFFAALMVRK